MITPVLVSFIILYSTELCCILLYRKLTALLLTALLLTALLPTALLPTALLPTALPTP